MANDDKLKQDAAPETQPADTQTDEKKDTAAPAAKGKSKKQPAKAAAVKASEGMPPVPTAEPEPEQKPAPVAEAPAPVPVPEAAPTPVPTQEPEPETVPEPAQTPAPVAEATPPEKNVENITAKKTTVALPMLNRIYGVRMLSRPGGVVGLEPFATRETAQAFIDQHGLNAAPFPYQTAWLAVDRWHTKHVRFAGRRRTPFRTALEARDFIRRNPDLGSRHYTVLPWEDGFCIVSRDMENTLRRCAPPYIRMQIAAGGANDESVVQVQAGTRAILVRGRPFITTYAVFKAIEDARGPMVDPDNSGSPQSVGYKVRSASAPKYPIQVFGPATQHEHRTATEHGRRMREMQIERLANEERLRVATTSYDTYGMDDDTGTPDDDAL